MVSGNSWRHRIGEESDKNWANKSIMYLKKLIKKHDFYAVFVYSEGVSMILVYLLSEEDINKFKILFYVMVIYLKTFRTL